MKLGTLRCTLTSTLVALCMAGCGNFVSENPHDGTFDSYLSECDGFASQTQALETPPPTLDRGDDLYCDAERLYWEYDAGAQQLVLFNTRAMLNCCGEHDLDVALVDGTYTVTETDDPESMGRCHCTCPFDFLADITNVQRGTIQLVLQREVTDWPDGSGVILDTELDLTPGSGVIVIDDRDETGMCTEPVDS
jgi:hypothetical protein